MLLILSFADSRGGRQPFGGGEQDDNRKIRLLGSFGLAGDTMLADSLFRTCLFFGRCKRL